MAVKFGEFDLEEGCWKSYIERFMFTLEANNIQEDKLKKANLMSVCGHTLYDLILSLITPSQVSQVTFDNIKNVLDNHFHPQLNEIIQSYKFHMRNQGEGEKVKDFMAELRKLSAYCNFIDLERTLRDRLVCGIKNKETQKELLRHPTLTFQQAYEIAVTAETSELGVLMINNGSQANNATGYSAGEPMEINKFKQKPITKQPYNSNKCMRCGKPHTQDCRFRFATCNFCKKTGHIESACLTKQRRNANQLEMVQSVDTEDRTEERCNHLISKRITPFRVEVQINKKSIVMEIDSGAGYSMMSEKVAKYVWNNNLPRMNKSDIQLITWTNDHVAILGKIETNVTFKNITKKLNIVIAKGSGPSLIGRDWFEELNIGIRGIYYSNIKMPNMKPIIDSYPQVFNDGLGQYTGPAVTITPDLSVTPKFLKSRPVPFALRERVVAEINRLVEQDVLEAVTYSKWATPLVPIIKKDGAIRLCGDYRATVNSAIELDTYPLPTINEAFAALQGGCIFTKLDLEQAYTQVAVDEPTSYLLAVNTPTGLYRVKRLAFGVKASPGIFQRLMASLLGKITGIAVLLDDILIAGRNVEEHNQRLMEVLKKLQEAGLRLNKKKCKFATTSVEFLGFRIDADGIHPCDDKVQAIYNTPAPRNVQELQAFLGLINFYDRFMLNKATIVEPSYKLLEKSIKWEWRRIHQEAKNLLQSDITLVHYNPNKKITMTCDASQYGLGAVLDHEWEDGTLKPIMLASRTMSKQERNYAQIDKEAAAIIFGLKKFHQYIYGRHVVIRTDHKPLLGIFDQRKPIPQVLSPRMLRWALLLNSYNYDLQYIPGPQIQNADSLSRWPAQDKEVNEEEEEVTGVLLMQETPDELKWTAADIAKITHKDIILAKVLYWIKNGWPTKSSKEYKDYWLKRNEMSIYENCILWGNRVVIPKIMQKHMLKLLHENHDGIVVTKALARSYLWWPGIDKEIEEMTLACNRCQMQRNMPAKVTHKWITPGKPWSRVHIDFAGPFQGKVFLILIDAFSKWPEVKTMNNQSSTAVINVLRDIFAEQGIPDTVVSDNGTAFTSGEFEEFLEGNGIEHIRAPPYSPVTNGQAERTVQTVKQKLKKTSDIPWQIRLPRILYGLRTTPSTVTNKSPAEMLNSRRFKINFDKIHPLTKQTTMEKQIKSNEQVKVRELVVGQPVLFRNYSQGERWLKGTIVRNLGPCRYHIEALGKIFTRHINQIVRRVNSNKDNEDRRERGEIRQPRYNEEKEREEEDRHYERRMVTPPPKEWPSILGIPGPLTEEASGEAGMQNQHRPSKRVRQDSPQHPTKRQSLEELGEDNDNTSEDSA